MKGNIVFSRPSALRCVFFLTVVSLLSCPFQAAANVPISIAAEDQNYPQIVSDGAGGAIIVWDDRRNTSNYDLYAQRVSAAGDTQWTANGVLAAGGDGDQSGPKILSDGAGGAFIIWHDTRNDGYGDVYAQHINSAGTALWTANGVVVCDAVRAQRDIGLVSDGAGGIIISWTDYRNSSHLDIYAQRLNSSGVPQWTSNGVPVCTAANGQQDPVITGDGAGGAIIAWADHRGTPSGAKGIYAQRLNSAGAPQWVSNGVPAYAGTRGGQYPQIVQDGSGGAIISWYDDRTYPTGSYDIYAQRLNSGGSTLWTGGGVVVSGAYGPQEHPQLVGDGSGGAFITWSDYRGSSSDIYAQYLNAAGALQWTSNGVPVCTSSGDQWYPRIIHYGSASTIITWYDDRDSDYDIYAQRLDGSGGYQWQEDGAVVSDAQEDQESPELIGDGSGGALIAWSDYRSGTDYDIYAQRIFSNGLTTLPEVFFTGADQQVVEDVVSTDITVQLSAASSADVTVPFTLSGTAASGSGEDYQIQASPIIINGGETEAIVTVLINDDSVVETDETIVITLGTPTNADLGTTTVHTVTIEDNEPTADIAVDKSVNTPRPELNQLVTFLIEVSNNGPDNATNIVISDPLDSGLAYVSHTASQGNYNPSSTRWNVGSLNNGGMATLSIIVQVNQEGSITNTATTISSSPADPQPANNSGKATIHTGNSVLTWLMLLLGK